MITRQTPERTPSDFTGLEPQCEGRWPVTYGDNKPHHGPPPRAWRHGYCDEVKRAASNVRKSGKPYKVTAAQRATYERLAALCGLYGFAAKMDTPPIAGPAPQAFSVLASDEWVIWFDSADMTGTEHVYSYREVRSLIGMDAPTRKPGKAEVLTIARELAAMLGDDVPAHALKVLEAA